MRDRGRLTAPGDLLNGTVLTPGPDPLAGPDKGNRGLAELAAEYGLRPSSVRPGLVSYLKMVWQRRHFIVACATARNVSMYTEARLGQLWQVLTPLRDEPNFRHSLPTKVVEYMARGVPVVTTPLPAAAELARGHECGFVVPFGDPRAAADAVLGLDGEISLRAKMGRRGHEEDYLKSPV